MTTGKDLKGKPIYLITDGRKLGEIKDLYLDAGASRIVALFLGKEGVFSRKTLVMPRDQIQVLGFDAWLADGAAAVVDIEDLEGSVDYLRVSDVRGRDIETDGGTAIGTVGDVKLDDDGGVIGFTLGKVQIQGKLAKSKLIAVGAVTTLGNKNSAMIVDLQAAEQAAQ